MFIVWTNTVFRKFTVGAVRQIGGKFHHLLRAGVHAPTKSVPVPATISMLLIFHVSLCPGSTWGRHDKVIGTTTDMSA